MRLAILWVGKTRDRRLAGLIEDYIGRIRRYCRLEVIEVRDADRGASGGQRRRVEKEGARILEALRPWALRVAFDERGRGMTSPEFAAFLGRALERTQGGVALIVGGPYGLSEAVLEDASHRCALSQMTLTHEMARLVAVDQVYRAFTILRGESYHH